MSDQLLLEIKHQLELLTNAVLSTKKILMIDEAAILTGLTVSYLYKLTSSQEIPHYKPRGKKLYFIRSELEDWLLQNRIKTLSEIQETAISHIATNLDPADQNGSKY